MPEVNLRYYFCICNNFIDFENFDYLNISQVDVNMKNWQIYGNLNFVITKNSVLSIGAQDRKPGVAMRARYR